MKRESFFRTLNWQINGDVNKKVVKNLHRYYKIYFISVYRVSIISLVTLVEQFANREYATIPIKHGTKENPVVKLLSSCF